MAIATSRPRRAKLNRDKPGIIAWLWLLVVAGYFILPLVAMGIFSFWAGGTNYSFAAYEALMQDGDMWRSLLLSVRLAIETIIITQVLLIPTVLFVSLRAPKLRFVLEMISNMPFVVPAIVLVAGLSALYRGPSWFVSSPEFMIPGYVILALPYTYRSLDVGVRALDVKTLTQAGLSLGASWTQIFMRVIIPNLRSAIVGSTLLMLAIVLGEFTFANVLLFNTFAVYINHIGQTSGTEAAALSLFSFLITWLAMLGIMVTGAKRHRGGRSGN